MRKVNSYVQYDENNKIPIEAQITSVTYDELVSLKNDGKLTPKTYYTITDFVTVDLVYGTTDDITIGTPEPLTVMATGNNQISRQVYSSLYPEDIILYDITDINCGDDNLTPRKGRIIRRTDQYNNSTPWDFRNVKFRMLTIEVDNYNELSEYDTGSLVKKNGWIYKAAMRADAPTPAGNDPELSNTLYWIKFLPVGSNLIPYPIGDGPKTNNIGSCVNSGVSYTYDYFYTFSNNIGQENSNAFENIFIGDGSNNIVLISGDEDFRDLTIGEYCTNLRIKGNVEGSSIKSYSENNIINGDFFGVTCNGYPMTNNILGEFRSVTINGIFSGNIIRSATNGCVFQSETVYNSIDTIANGVSGSDLWNCRIGNLSYYNLAYRFTDSSIENGNQFSTLSSCLQCEFKGEQIGISVLLPISLIVFPSMKSTIIELASDYGNDFSTSSGTILAALTNASIATKIVGDDTDGFYVLQRTLGKETIIT